jgi:hypothetical protein
MGAILVEKEKYDKLLRDQAFLLALLAAGVDNWEGYDAVSQELENSIEFFDD